MMKPLCLLATIAATLAWPLSVPAMAQDSIYLNVAFRQTTAAKAMYHEDGTLNKDIYTFMRNAQYPGGMTRQNQFINQHLRHPDTAAGKKSPGTVLIAFTVSEEGKLSDYRITFSNNPDLNAEALRVVGLMPDWEPAIRGGVYISGFGQAAVQIRSKSKK
jgi:TonB family protein